MKFSCPVATLVVQHPGQDSWVPNWPPEGTFYSLRTSPFNQCYPSRQGQGIGSGVWPLDRHQGSQKQCCSGNRGRERAAYKTVTVALGCPPSTSKYWNQCSCRGGQVEQLFQRPIFAHALLKVFFRNAPSFAPFCSFLEKGMPEASVLTRSHVYDVKENVQ